MSGHSVSFNDLTFDKIDPAYKAFAIKILDALFFVSRQGLNLEEIYGLFNNYHKNAIRKTVEYLSNTDIGYIRMNNDSKNEKRYIITDFGINKIISFYNK